MNVHECEEGDQGLEQNEEFEGPPDRSATEKGTLRLGPRTSDQQALTWGKS